MSTEFIFSRHRLHENGDVKRSTMHVHGDDMGENEHPLNVGLHSTGQHGCVYIQLHVTIQCPRGENDLRSLSAC